MVRRGSVLSLAVMSAAALLVAGCGGGPEPRAVPSSGAVYRGVEPEPVGKRPSFVLRDTAGNRYDFLAQTRGRPTYVYFGYTNCPDECPTALADIAAALRRTGKDLRDKVRVVFVTTDPKRDTAPVIRRFLDQFSTTFVGLLGTEAEVRAAQQAVGIAPAETEGPIPVISGQPNAHPHKSGTAPHQHFGPLGYGVAHANVIFAYDVSDRLPVVYPGGVVPSDIAADLPVLARQEERP
ncbi:MAG TPA: SCO family protein [Mycobacteriales bacterium]|nr:SCO family protein [Mycobacteriales bacterium]